VSRRSRWAGSGERPWSWRRFAGGRRGLAREDPLPHVEGRLGDALGGTELGDRLVRSTEAFQSLEPQATSGDRVTTRSGRDSRHGGILHEKRMPSNLPHLSITRSAGRVLSRLPLPPDHGRLNAVYLTSDNGCLSEGRGPVMSRLSRAWPKRTEVKQRLRRTEPSVAGRYAVGSQDDFGSPHPRSTRTRC